jgi:hypothetical protein
LEFGGSQKSSTLLFKYAASIRPIARTLSSQDTKLHPVKECYRSARGLAISLAVTAISVTWQGSSRIRSLVVAWSLIGSIAPRRRIGVCGLLVASVHLTVVMRFAGISRVTVLVVVIRCLCRCQQTAHCHGKTKENSQANSWVGAGSTKSGDSGEHCDNPL